MEGAACRGYLNRRFMKHTGEVVKDIAEPLRARGEAPHKRTRGLDERVKGPMLMLASRNR